MSSPTFDIALLPEYASDKSIQRGREYFREGAVGGLVLRGNQLQANVAGGQPRPYRVEIEFDAEGGAEACCTCPYDYEGWCKHIVAVLLAYAEQPNQVETRSPLVQRLAALDRAQLQTLVLELVERVPRLVDVVEVALTLLALAPEALATGVASASATPCPPASVNIQAIRQQTRSLLRSIGSRWDHDGYDNEEDEVSPDLIDLLEPAQAFLDAGDGRSALAILDAVTDEVRKRWDALEEIGLQPYDFIDEVQSLWIEGLLDPTLSADERQHWITTLAGWEDDFDSDGSGFIVAAQIAARQGWDDPALDRILHGETVPGGLWGDNPPRCAEAITQARLKILERGGRDEAYLNLARAEGFYLRYALRLLQLDRVQEAIAVGLQQPLAHTDRLELAKALHQRGEIAAALDVAEYGLQHTAAPVTGAARIAAMSGDGWRRDSERGVLAGWLRDRAIEQGQTERALVAGVIAFQEITEAATYRQLQQLAGSGWPELKLSLLEFLRTSTHPYTDVKVDIFLSEDLLDDAIKTVESHHASSETLAQVMDAAIKKRPEWVMIQAHRQAEPIMNEGKSAHYEDAVMWLRKAKKAHDALGQTAEWRSYLGALCDKHQRKYKLMPLLRML